LGSTFFYIYEVNVFPLVLPQFQMLQIKRKLTEVLSSRLALNATPQHHSHNRRLWVTGRAST